MSDGWVPPASVAAEMDAPAAEETPAEAAEPAPPSLRAAPAELPRQTAESLPPGSDFTGWVAPGRKAPPSPPAAPAVVEPYRRRHVFRWVALGVIAVILVGVAAAYAAIPPFRDGVSSFVHDSRKNFQRTFGIGSYGPVHPTGVSASSSQPNHGASLLTNLISNDYWSADLAKDPQPVITLTFHGPTDLDYLIVTSGAAADFSRLGRPKDVTLTYSDGSSEHLRLRDEPAPQGYDIHGRGASTVMLRIDSTYAGSGTPSVAIAELEFFRLD